MISNWKSGSCPEKGVGKEGGGGRGGDAGQPMRSEWIQLEKLVRIFFYRIIVRIMQLIYGLDN